MKLWEKEGILTGIIVCIATVCMWLKIDVPSLLVPTVILSMVLAYLVIYFDHRLGEKQDRRGGD